MSKTTTSIVQTNFGPMKAIHIHVPVGIPTADGGLEIPNRVFLGGIPNETTELELELFFSDFGVVKDVRIVTDRHTGESKGYGFVTFDESEDISHLLKKQNIIMKGKKLRVRKAIRRNSSQFQNSENESPTCSENSSSAVTVSRPQSVSSGNNNNNSNNESEPVVFVPNYNHCGSVCSAGLQPVNYSTYNMPPSHGSFVPVGPPQALPGPPTSTPSNYSSNTQQYQTSGGAASYQPVLPQTCHPIYYLPYNGPMPPHYSHHHQPGYNYPVYQTLQRGKKRGSG